MKSYSCLLTLMAVAVACPLTGGSEGHASGGGTYILSGIRTEFQLSETHVQCKIGRGIFPNGTIIQMFMESKTIKFVTIDSIAKTVVLSGTMVSETRLQFTDGTATTLTETVPFVAFAQDKATPGAGADTFSITVTYTNTPGFDQFDFFGSPATFAGTLESGDVEVR